MYRFRISIVFSFLLFFSCSTTKDRWINIKFHETTGHYNAYFNGLVSFEESVAQFEQGEKLDFEAVLPFYHWPDEKEATALFSAMDRAIEKSAKVITNHSMVFSGKQRNNYVLKSYLLTAKARFYKHELLPALEVTNYMKDQFAGLEIAEDEVFESTLLSALIQARLGNFYAAEEELNSIYTKKLPKSSQHQVEKAFAYLYYENGNLAQSQQWCAMAVTTAPNKEARVRLAYTNAQLLSQLKKKYESALAFEQVVDMHPNDYNIAFSAKLKRAENFDVFAEDIGVIEKELNKLLRDDKNINYRDQIYYIWAQKHLDLENFPRAEELLRLSIAQSVDNTRQKGKSYLSLANIEFDFKSYVEAQAFYDSALAVLPADYPGLDTLSARRQNLNDLVVQLDIIALEDSLQALYGMSDENLRTKFSKHIENKLAREEELRRQQELQARRQAQNELLAAEGPKAGQGGKWYFYNPAVRSSGMTAFRKQWGDRKLEDFWRTKEKPMDGFDLMAPEAATASEESTDSTRVEMANLPSDENSVDYYMARVLRSPEQLKQSWQRESEAIAEAGFIYKDGLSDADEALRIWGKEASSSYTYAAAHVKSLYGKYLVYKELENERLENETKEEVLTNYPNSPYALLMSGQQLGPQVAVEEQQAYDGAQEAFDQGQFLTARQRAERFKTMYPSSALNAKLALLEAYISGQLDGESAVLAQLKGVVKNFSGTLEAARASQLLLLLQTPTVDPSKTGSDANAASDGPTVTFSETDAQPYKFVIALPNENNDIQGLRNALADFNKEHYKFDNLRIQNIFYNQDIQLVIVSGLKTRAKAVVYMESLSTLGSSVLQFVPLQSSDLFVVNNANFGKIYRDKVLKEYVAYFEQLP